MCIFLTMSYPKFQTAPHLRIVRLVTSVKIDLQTIPSSIEIIISTGTKTVSAMLTRLLLFCVNYCGCAYQGSHGDV